MKNAILMTLGLLAACSTPTAGYHPDDCITDGESGFGFAAYEDGVEAAWGMLQQSTYCDEGYDGLTPHDPEYAFGRWHGIPLLEACYTFGWDMRIEVYEEELCQ
jgi:hypothetical protein